MIIWGFIIYHNQLQFSKCHIFDKYLSIFKKSDSFGKLSQCTIKFSHYFFKSIRIWQRYKGFCEEHFLKLLEIKYFVSNFQHAITWLNLGQISKSQAVLESSLHELQDFGIGSWIWIKFRFPESSDWALSNVAKIVKIRCNLLG